jgi:hypothetical protein
MSITPTFSGEVMMAGWSDTHTSGEVYAAR